MWCFRLICQLHKRNLYNQTFLWQMMLNKCGMFWRYLIYCEESWKCYACRNLEGISMNSLNSKTIQWCRLCKVFLTECENGKQRIFKTFPKGVSTQILVKIIRTWWFKIYDHNLLTFVWNVIAEGIRVWVNCLTEQHHIRKRIKIENIQNPN